MMQKNLLIFSVILIVGFIPISYSIAQTQSAKDLQALIDNLLTELASLQAQVSVLQAEQKTSGAEEKKELQAEQKAIRAQIIFTRTLRRGARGKDVEEVQAYLALSPDIYPESLVTGYFGPLTEKAIQRFQKKHGIVSFGTPSTTGYGQAGPKTRAKINELISLGAGKSDVVPPGLPTAPGVDDTTEPKIISETDDTTSPSVSDIQISNITEVSATITWVTDEETTGKVVYIDDTTTPLSSAPFVTDIELSTNHTVILKLLSPGTKYYYAIFATDNNGNETESQVQSFSTKEVETVTETSDIIGHWTFDETEGTAANDSSGNANHGVLINMDPSIAWVSGKIDGALKFDGVDDYVTIPHSDSINIGAVGESYTVSVWFNRSGIPKFERLLIGKQEGAGPSPFEFRIDQAAYVIFRITDGAEAPFIRPPKTISGNGWNHIVGVRNADTDRIHVYINGEEGAGTGTEKGLSVMDTTIGSIQNEDPILINRYKGVEFFYYDLFTIDDVRIYNRALSATEIKELYDAGK